MTIYPGQANSDANLEFLFGYKPKPDFFSCNIQKNLFEFEQV